MRRIEKIKFYDGKLVAPIVAIGAPLGAGGFFTVYTTSYLATLIATIRVTQRIIIFRVYGTLP